MIKVRLNYVICFLAIGLCAAANNDSLKKAIKSLSGLKKIEAQIQLANSLRVENPKDAEPLFLESINSLNKTPDEELLFKAKLGLAKTSLKIDKIETGLKIFAQVQKDAGAKSMHKFVAEAANMQSKFYSGRDPKKSIELSLIAEKAALKVNDYNQLSNSFNYRGQAYFFTSNYKKAAECFESSRSYYALAKDESGIAGMTMNLGIIYFKMNDFERSIENYQKALLKFKEAGDTTNMAHALTNIGISEKNLGRIKNSGTHLSEAFLLYNLLQDSLNIAMCLENIALLEYEMDNRTGALDKLLQSLKIREKMAYTEEELITGYDNVCSMLSDIKQLEQARYYYSKAFHLAEKIGNSDKMASAYYHYSYLLEADGKLDSAILYQEKALELNKKKGGQGSLSANYSALGNFYSGKGKWNEALNYYVMSLDIKLQISDKLNLSDAYGNVARAYYELGNYKKSLSYNLLALQMSEETGIKQKVSEIYKSLANSHFKLGNVNEAYRYHVIYSHMKDSIYSLDANRQLAEMSEKFESEKKKKEITLLKKDGEVKNLELLSRQKDIEKQRTVIIVSMAGLLVFVLLSIIIFRALKLNQKAKAEIAIQKNMIEEKQKEIVDSIKYARRIQKAHLPTNISIENDLKRLKKKVS